MYHFCTITTGDHLYKTLTLYDSLRAIHEDVFLHVLCIDTLPIWPAIAGTGFYSTAEMAGQPSADTILSTYSGYRDKLRWCLKPVFLRYLLETKADKVIYADNDIYFLGDYEFLFGSLEKHDFLLTPHHYPRDPSQGQNWLEANFKVGLYNAGFVGVNKDAVPCLDWWAACCAYRCEKSALRGTYDDQKYLDLIPVMDEGALIVRHKGCNIAEWNRHVIPRSEKGGQVMLDGTYPLIFIHYTGTTVRAIRAGLEPFLQSSFNTYLNNLKKYKADVTGEDLENKQSVIDAIKYTLWKWATRWGW